ncbi:adenylyl-sulfate kinase [Owenweeksia hongkongensis]|uniref:adenylyl-sulfate kinase n=1 Tax=Owenweeksia hongkongensis TaxID=253245 RepID=UPI003A90B3A4
MIIWLTGLSGAGKTTVGTVLFRRIKREFPNTVFLDGDILRDVWGGDLGHDIDSRLVNARRISMLSKMLDRQGINVVACVLSISPDWRRWNRKEFSKYFEVKLEPGMDVLRKRDSKGLYRAAERGEIKDVVGVDIPLPTDRTDDLTFSGPDALRSPDDLAETIFDIVRDKMGLKK